MTAPPFPRKPDMTRSVMRPHLAPLGQAVRRYQILPVDVHTTLLAVDIAGFGDPGRATEVRLRLREMLYDHLNEASPTPGLPGGACHREDRGDGAFIVAPADTRPDDFLDPLA